MRELFRRLRDPQAEHGALAAALLERSSESDLRAAVVAFVDETLRDYDPHYREIVVRTDIRGKPGKQVAAELALSPRTYYRLRAIAIAALERALAALLDAAGPARTAGDPHAELLDVVAALDPARAHAIVEQLDSAGADRLYTALRLRVFAGEVPADEEFARLDETHRFRGEVVRARAYESSGRFVEAETLVALLEADPGRRLTEHRTEMFELAVIRRLQARRRGRGAEHAAAAADMVERAGDDPVLKATATIAHAHVAIHSPVDDWRERLDRAKHAIRTTARVGLLRYATMVEGYLAYIYGDPELALNRARISTLEGSHPSVALQGEALHARAALVLGSRWQRAPWTEGVLPNTWFQAELDALGAHHALVCADETAARRLAAGALAHPSAPFAPPVVALAAAVPSLLNGNGAETGVEIDDVLTDVDLRTLDAVRRGGRPPQQPPSSNGPVRSIRRS